jgi:hypothetical protein
MATLCGPCFGPTRLGFVKKAEVEAESSAYCNLSSTSLSNPIGFLTSLAPPPRNYRNEHEIGMKPWRNLEVDPSLARPCDRGRLGQTQRGEAQVLLAK